MPKTPPYSGYYSNRETPQNEPIPGAHQVQNNAGGYVFKVDKFQQLQRFLIFGSEGGTYYVSERKLTKENAQIITLCLNEDYVRTINIIEEISVKGRAPKNEPALFALAIASAHSNESARKMAFDKLETVARIPTHLFSFAEYMNGIRGWGKLAMNAFRKWYNDKDPEKLAFLMTKYQSRNGWSHRDIINLAHIGGRTDAHKFLYQWAMGGWEDNWSISPGGVISGEKTVKSMTRESGRKVHRERKERFQVTNAGFAAPIVGMESLKNTKREEDVVQVIEKYRLVREHIPTEWLNKPLVQQAMLPHMGLTSLIRNLGNMGKSGLLVPGRWDAINTVIERLNGDMQKSRVHPLQLLMALKVYSNGRGMRGDGTWEVVPQVVDALEKAFYASFGLLESHGKRIYLGVDISGSMGSALPGMDFITCAEGAAVMAMVLARKEQNYVIKGFDDSMKYLPVSPGHTLYEVLRIMGGWRGGGTDCSLPILDALKSRIVVDCFINITDNETWAGKIHPVQALDKYRREMGIDAKMVVVGMTSTGFSIAHPNDPSMLDVVGFDTSAPAIIHDFIKGEV